MGKCIKGAVNPKYIICFKHLNMSNMGVNKAIYVNFTKNKEGTFYFMFASLPQPVWEHICVYESYFTPPPTASDKSQ